MTVKVLDLYCGEGGAAYGIKQAISDAEITGVDIVHQERYPYTFIQGDALEVGYEIGKNFDIIWASPPCQAYCFSTEWYRTNNIKQYPDLVKKTRRLLRKLSKPYMIENVPGSPLRGPAILLCGTMFDLKIFRHRYVETNPEFERDIIHPTHVTSIGKREAFTVAGNGVGTTKEWQEAMGIHWMNKRGLRQAVPPAYSKYITLKLLETLHECRITSKAY